MTFECDHGEVCITCGDVALELRVVRIDRDRALALCADEADRTETVETGLMGSVRPGEKLLVHAGTAIARLEVEA